MEEVSSNNSLKMSSHGMEYSKNEKKRQAVKETEDTQAKKKKKATKTQCTDYHQTKPVSSVIVTDETFQLTSKTKDIIESLLESLPPITDKETRSPDRRQRSSQTLHGIVPTTIARSGILECISRMKEIKVNIAGEEYTIIKCSTRFKLSILVSPEFPDFILIRRCTLEIMALIKSKIKSVRRFLITGTPGVGKTISIIEWLYLALKGESKILYFKYIIADLKTGCILFSQSPDGTWSEKWCRRTDFHIRGFADPNEVLYLYDATFDKVPLLLPYCSVVFCSPNLRHFKEFINISSTNCKIYFTPTWRWDEIQALYNASPPLHTVISLLDIQSLFEIWGGLPRQIFVPYQIGYDELIAVISSCDAVACNLVQEKGNNFLSYCLVVLAKEVRSELMHFQVVSDGTYEHFIVTFGTSFIRERLVESSGNGFTK